jgi:uncharacterized protein DUF6985
MRIASICILACCALIAFSSCASKTQDAEMEAGGEDQGESAADVAAAKAAMQNLLPGKTEVVRLTAFPGDLELEKKLRPEDQNQKVGICDAHSGGASDSQHHALKEFVANEKQIFRAVREAIYRHYQENYLPHREQLRSMLRQTATNNGYSPAEWEKKGMDDLPDIKTGNELDQKVTLLAISVHCPVNGVSKIGLLYQCPWERDDDLGVRLAGSVVEAVGTGEVAYTD